MIGVRPLRPLSPLPQRLDQVARDRARAPEALVARWGALAPVGHAVVSVPVERRFDRARNL